LADHNEAARQAYREAYSIGKHLKNPVDQAIACRYLGDLEKYLANYDEARTQYKEALRLFQSKHHKLGEADTLCGQAELEIALEPRGGAAAGLLAKALKIYGDQKHTTGYARVERAFGNLARLQDRDQEARAHYRKALGYLQNLGDKLGEANVLSFLAEMDRAVSAFDYAESSFKAALALYPREGHAPRGGELPSRPWPH
jgi:tetratricopeptide (TPR) repeat protein